MSAVPDMLRRLGREKTAPNLALMHLILAAEAPGEIDDALEGETSGDRWFADVGRLWRETPEAFEVVKSLAASVSHAPAEAGEEVTSRFADGFDAAARANPIAAGAMFTLGRPDLQERRLAEIVGLLDHWTLLDPPQRVLELGCGSGDLARRIASRCTSYLGLDIAPAMIGLARESTPEDGPRFERTNGTDLSGIKAGSIDRVFAIDVFPYLVLAGADRAGDMLAEIARVLPPSGEALVVNFAYGLNSGDEAAALARACDQARLYVADTRQRWFTLWDGRAYRLKRAAR